MKNVLIHLEPEPPPVKRRVFPFAGATPPTPGVLTYFKTRRIQIKEHKEKLFIRKPNLAWMYGGAPPAAVPLTYFLRKSAFVYKQTPFKNLGRHLDFNPLFLIQPGLVILGDGPGGGQIGIGALSGGKQRLQIFIAGNEITLPMPQDVPQPLVYGLGDAVGAQPLRIVSQTIGRGTAAFDIYDQNGTLSIELGQTVLIQEFGIRLFAGCISTLTPEIFWRSNGTSFLVWHVNAVDKSGIFDHRVVITPFYPSGMDAADIIRDLFTNPAACNPPLSQEGITTNNVPVSLGPISTDIIITLWTVTQLMNALMTDIGGVWWIDTTSDLNALLVADIGPAPFSVTMTSKNWRKGANLANLGQYFNKPYALSDRVVEPDNTVPGITGTPTVETWTLPQALANSLGYLPLSIVTNFPMLKVTGLKVNGVAQPVYVGSAFPFINLRHVWWYFPQTNNLIPPNVQGANGFPDPPATSPDPSPGDIVRISYLAPTQSTAVVAGDPLAPSFGTCGSGVWEWVQQVKGITKQSDLKAIVTALLAKNGIIAKTLQFETDQPGLFVGMRLTVDIPPLDLASTTLMITGIDGTALDAVKGLGFGSRFRWQITATNTQDLGNSIEFLIRLYQQTLNGPPLPRLRAYNWVLAPGGSLSGGVLTSSPQDVLDTGQVFKASLQFQSPPTDQDVTVDIISAAQGSILGGPQVLKVTAGSTSLVSITQFTNDPAPFYLFQGDNLTVVVTYGNLGANPVNGSNGKLTLQVSF